MADEFEEAAGAGFDVDEGVVGVVDSLVEELLVELLEFWPFVGTEFTGDLAVVGGFVLGANFCWLVF